MADQIINNFTSRSRRQVKRESFGHTWQTVINPVSKNHVLQACDHCGVVKSENSIVKACRGNSNARLLSSDSLNYLQRVV